MFQFQKMSKMFNYNLVWIQKSNGFRFRQDERYSLEDEEIILIV